jgi:hypothetical protein
VLAAVRKKQQVSHSITIDSGLLTHGGGCSHGVGGNNSLRTCFDAVSVGSDFPS